MLPSDHDDASPIGELNLLDQQPTSRASVRTGSGYLIDLTTQPVIDAPDLIGTESGSH